MSELVVRNATASRWDDLTALLGRSGGDNGCWCQYWLLGREYTRRGRDANRDDLREQLSAGRAGLIAYRDGEPVGWARLTPRADLAYLPSRFPGLEPVRRRTLSLPCFFVARTARGTGVMSALISRAVDAAAARVFDLEAYPVDASIPGATENRFSGVLDAFVRAGFEKDRSPHTRPCPGASEPGGPVVHVVTHPPVSIHDGLRDHLQ